MRRDATRKWNQGLIPGATMESGLIPVVVVELGADSNESDASICWCEFPFSAGLGGLTTVRSTAAGAAGMIRAAVADSIPEQHHGDATNMASHRPPSVPDQLRSMVQLNTAYRVLICPHEQCRKAVQPSAFTRHSHEEHGTTIRARRNLEAFIKELAWAYDSRTIQKPDDGSTPQPTIPVSDGVECRLCIAEKRNPTFKTRRQTSTRKIMKAHGNKVHQRNKVPDDGLYRAIRVQTWFRGNGEARYWRVEEGDAAVDETPVVHGRSGMADAIDDAAIAMASGGEPADTQEAEARAAIMIIESGDEAFVCREEGPIPAATGDSRDESARTPEMEATATAVVIDSDDELLVSRRRRPTRAVESVSAPETEVAAVGIVIESNDAALVPRSQGYIDAVEVDSSDEADGDADYIPSSEDVSSDDDGGSSTVATDASDAEDGDARGPTAGRTTTVITPPGSGRPSHRRWSSLIPTTTRISRAAPGSTGRARSGRGGPHLWTAEW